MYGKRQGRAWYHWYAETDSPAERRLIQKLDLLIVPYAVVAYWIKYIDQSNLSKSDTPLQSKFNLTVNKTMPMSPVYKRNSASRKTSW